MWLQFACSIFIVLQLLAHVANENQSREKMQKSRSQKFAFVAFAEKIVFKVKATFEQSSSNGNFAEETKLNSKYAAEATVP